MREKKRDSSKRASAGEGEIVSLRFSELDHREQRALATAKLLAVVPGRRKEYLVVFLAALGDVYESDQKLPDPADITNALRALGRG